jgi:hypothetical protein
MTARFSVKNSHFKDALILVFKKQTPTAKLITERHLQRRNKYTKRARQKKKKRKGNNNGQRNCNNKNGGGETKKTKQTGNNDEN